MTAEDAMVLAALQNPVVIGVIALASQLPERKVWESLADIKTSAAAYDAVMSTNARESE